MTNEELIKALRYCGNFVDRDGCDEECPYFNDKDCPKRIMCDAADALEALLKERTEMIKGAKKTAKVYAKFYEKYNELEARFPKEAHWVAVENGHGVCSNCNRQDSIDNMATHCRYCGARMTK